LVTLKLVIEHAARVHGLKPNVYKGLQGVYRKGFPSGSVTASLLIKGNKCMKRNIQLLLLFWLRKADTSQRGRKQRRISPAERNNMGMGAVEKDKVSKVSDLKVRLGYIAVSAERGQLS